MKQIKRVTDCLEDRPFQYYTIHILCSRSRLQKFSRYPLQGCNSTDLDTAHFYAGGSTLESIREVDPKRLVVLHINDVEDVAKPDISDGHRLYPGDGVIPLQDILGAVRATGWDGVLSVELFREEYWRLDPLTVAREAKARTSTVWERVPQHDGR